MAEFLTSDNHSLGPWPKTRDTRLFSYHERIFKVRLILGKAGCEEVAVGLAEFQPINNAQLQADIDRCVASLLKKPPTKAAPTTYKVSTSTTFTVELRSWKADQKFIDKMHSSNMQVYPYSFKVTGQTSHQFYIEPIPQNMLLDTSQSDGEKSVTESNENSDSDIQEKPENVSSQSTLKEPSQNSQPPPLTTSSTQDEALTKSSVNLQISQNVDLRPPSPPLETPQEAKEIILAPEPPKEADLMTETSDLMTESSRRCTEKVVTETESFETAREHQTEPQIEEEGEEVSSKSKQPSETVDTLQENKSEEMQQDCEKTPTKPIEREYLRTPTQSEVLKDLDRVSLQGGEAVAREPTLLESPRKRRSCRNKSGDSGSSVQSSRDSEAGPSKKAKRTSTRKSKRSVTEDEPVEKSQRCTSPKRVRMDIDDDAETGAGENPESPKLRKVSSESGDHSSAAKLPEKAVAQGDHENLNKTQPVQEAKPQEEAPKSRRSCIVM